ncbi:hypothetical protein SEA_TONIANN_25 [Gordonia phage Toniann]|nr:hypothetical protein SEA_TONIANN_25 [Gordonia phage Toniann]QKY79605.1 hypothetical protein SEA_ENGINEER_26 [Gordonia Phage Engineer]
MPGPCSAPNGDVTLMSMVKDHCPHHGAKLGECAKNARRGEDCPRRVTKRQFLQRIGKLDTGKTRKRR